MNLRRHEYWRSELLKKKPASPVLLASEVRILPSPLQLAGHKERERGVEDMKLRFDEVLYDLEQERQRVDEDLRRFAVVAAYLRTLLLPARRRRRPRRRRCTPRSSLTS